MASLEFDNVAEKFRVRFRYDNREYKRSLKTDDGKVARGLVGRIEYTLQLIERGELSIPENADPATFIVTAGKRMGEEKTSHRLTRKELFETYEAKLPQPLAHKVTMSVTTRLEQRTADALRRAHLEQKLKGMQPATQQEIIEIAVQGWLRENGFLE